MRTSLNAITGVAALERGATEVSSATTCARCSRCCGSLSPVEQGHVLVTDELRSVRTLCDNAFSYVELDYRDFTLENAEHQGSLSRLRSSPPQQRSATS